MLPVYFLDTHHLLGIHRPVYRNFVESCILNIPLGTEFHVCGDSSAEGYETNKFIRTQDGFLYDPLTHGFVSKRCVASYVSDSSGWILTREVMHTLVLSGFGTNVPYLFVCSDHAKVLIWTDDISWKVGKRPHLDWKLVGYIQWYSQFEILNPKEKESTRIVTN
ncbi:hypothetical protein TNCV_5110381 [Trichonephila clavipes]|nr:hypothetical protein TNCV_5110381 [Trichonephila clavipes]